MPQPVAEPSSSTHTSNRLIDAFKTAQDFAAKQVFLPAGQEDWLAWNQDPNNPQRKRKLERIEEPKAPKPGEEEEVFVPKTYKKSKEELTVWAELRDAEGQIYYFNSYTGERTRTKPKSQEDAPSREEDASSAQELPPPPQVWRKTVDPLTRRPQWFCAEDKIVIKSAPRPPPWRAVALNDPGQPSYYWWNTETKETAWS